MVNPETPAETPAEAPAAVVSAEAPPAAPAPAPAAPVVQSLPPPSSGVFIGTGRRKTSIARVRLIRPGTGKVTVNGKPIEKRFSRLVLVDQIWEPLKVTNNENAFDVIVNVEGGGLTGQAGALRHGIARALLAFSPDLRRELRRAGCLTRDPRAKERRKYGLKKARKAEQYSKR